MYDPTIARFLQEDTYTGKINDPLSLNLYAYCNNNALIYNDPTGHWPKFLDDGIKVVADFVDEAKTAVSEAWSGVKSAAKDAWDGFKKLGSASVAKSTFLVNASIPISKAWDGFKSKASATWEGAKKTNPLTTAAYESIAKLGKGIIDIPKMVKNQINEYISSPVEKIKHDTALVGIVNGNRMLFPEKQDAIVNQLSEGIKTSFNDNVINGDTHTRAEFVFDTGLFIGSFFIGNGELKTAGTVAKLEEGINTASKFGEGVNATSKFGEGLAATSKGAGNTELYHSAGENVVDLIKENGFRTDLPNPQAAFHNNRFARGVYLADSPATALAERPGGVILNVEANLGKNLNITNRGFVDYDMAHSISRGARKHGYDSISFNSAQRQGGINTVIFEPNNARVRK